MKVKNVCSKLYCTIHFDIPWLSLISMAYVTVQVSDFCIYSLLTQVHTTYPVRVNRMFPSSPCKSCRVEFQLKNAIKTTKAYSGLLGCDTVSLHISGSQSVLNYPRVFILKGQADQQEALIFSQQST